MYVQFQPPNRKVAQGMPQAALVQNRPKLVKEPKVIQPQVVTFGLSGQWLPEGSKPKMSFFDLTDLKSQVNEANDPQLYRLVSELLGASVHIAHVWAERRPKITDFYVQLKPSFKCDPNSEKDKIDLIVRRHSA